MIEQLLTSANGYESKCRYDAKNVKIVFLRANGPKRKRTACLRQPEVAGIIAIKHGTISIPKRL